jgi:TetR/AcrR family transcriptional regulator
MPERLKHRLAAAASANGAQSNGHKARMRGDERRQHLIGVALRLFASHGFSGTTTKSIAAAAGISEAVIFRHFKSKEDLYAAILREKARQEGYDQTMDELRHYADRDDDEGLIFQLALRTLESFDRDPNFHRLMLYARLEGHDLARASKRVLGLPLFEFLRGYIVRRQRAGKFRKGDPVLLAFGIVALPMHYAMASRLFGVKQLRGSNRGVARSFTETILHGLSA